MIKHLQTVLYLHQEGKLHRRLLIMLFFMVILLLASVGVVIYDVLFAHLLWFLPFLIGIPSFFLGTWTSQRNRVDINEQQQLTMVSRMDKLGLLILGVYISLRFLSRMFFVHFLPGLITGGAFTFSSIVGIAAGRLYSILGAVTLAHHNSTSP